MTCNAPVLSTPVLVEFQVVFSRWPKASFATFKSPRPSDGLVLLKVYLALFLAKCHLQALKGPVQDGFILLEEIQASSDLSFATCTATCCQELVSITPYASSAGRVTPRCLLTNTLVAEAACICRISGSAVTGIMDPAHWCSRRHFLHSCFRVWLLSSQPPRWPGCSHLFLWDVNRPLAWLILALVRQKDVGNSSFFEVLHIIT